MGEGLALFLRDWGPGSIAALTVLMVLVGFLIPKPRHEKEISLIEASRQEALAREHFYRSANEKLQETVLLQAQQLKDLTEYAETSVALLESIERRAGGGRHSRLGIEAGNGLNS